MATVNAVNAPNAMFMMPALVDAMQDRALRGHAREVYWWFFSRLDVGAFRAVKHSRIDHDLQIGDVAVKRAIDRLVERGYIVRGGRSGRMWTYRLVHSLHASTTAP